MHIHLYTLLAAAALMFAGWLFSLTRKSVNIVDSLWGLGFILVAWVTLLGAEFITWRGVIVAVLVTIWGLRLTTHLHVRNHGKPEDRRYAKMRANHPNNFPRWSLIFIFGLQALLLWVVSLAAQQAILAPASLPTWLDGAALLLWGIGFALEATADAQLAIFKTEPTNQGKVMDHGLWGVSRHPNYFGEACQWWGIFLLAGATGAWWSILSPLLLTFLLLKVSGIVMTEAGMAEHRPAYADYQRRVSAFIPWFPKGRP